MNVIDLSAVFFTWWFVDYDVKIILSGYPYNKLIVDLIWFINHDTGTEYFMRQLYQAVTQVIAPSRAVTDV